MNVTNLGDRTRLFVAVALLVHAAAPVHAWNDAGHMAVAYVAYQKLTPATRVRVKQLLKLNPYYPTRWMRMVPKGATAKERDRILFMVASTWPDQIKHDPAYGDDGSHDGDRPDGVSSTQNTGYGDHLRHKYWHFVDKPFARDRTALPPVPQPNAQTQLETFRAVLASTRADALKSYDLTWVLHLVGDVHQPLHCATRVSRSDRDGDAGGNAVVLRCPGCPDKLHAFWDDAFGADLPMPTSVITAAEKLPAPDPTLAAKSDDADWIAESFQAAQQKVYVAPVGAGHGPYHLTRTYKRRARAVARARIALAGARLANLLNRELQ